MTELITATQARKDFFKLIERASQPDSPVIITKGEHKVVMMSFEDFEGWIESFEIMSDPELVKGIEKGIKDIEKGNTLSLEELEKELNL